MNRDESGNLDLRAARTPYQGGSLQGAMRKKNVRAACLYIIAILISVAATVGGFQSRPLFWLCIGLAAIAAIVATLTLEPVASRLRRAPADPYKPILSYEGIVSWGNWAFRTGPLNVQIIRIRNSQLATENQANNVTANIEYIYAGGDRFSIPAIWLAPAASGAEGAEFPCASIFLGANETRGLVFLVDDGKEYSTTADMRQILKSLKPGIWTARIKVSCDNCDALTGEMSFTVIKEGTGTRIEYGQRRWQ
jgi:hypothetical protein